MTTVHDVAAYILASNGNPLPVMKLHKLAYYAQAWSLVWDDKPLFRNRIEAWANGPVVPDLYKLHRGKFEVDSWPNGDTSKLTGKERTTVDAVLHAYGHRTSQWLSDLTHSENPWRDAHGELAPGQRGTAEITTAALAEYYGSLDKKNAKTLG
jgi:uncharacterized phage-associated protein